MKQLTNSPHSKDLRKGRVSQIGYVYSITWTTDKRKPWFSDLILGRLVVASLRRIHDLGFVESLAFVIMPDHVHWLIGLKNGSLATVMRDVKSHSGFYVKQLIQKRGLAQPKAIWQDGYHDHALRAEENLRNVARYIVMNPVRAGLVESIREYPLWDAKWL
jgi:putative transposase